jgi:hypothetical protein
VRILVTGALADDEFTEDETEYSSGSVGDTVRRMITVYWPGESLRSVAHLLVSRPDRFDAELQHRTQVFHRV